MPCSLGVGCEEAGTCYADYHNRPDMCGMEGENPEDFDRYGNPISGDHIINCCFPDCGCDGAQHCMAENGPSNASCNLNYEGGTYSLRSSNFPKAR